MRSSIVAKSLFAVLALLVAAAPSWAWRDGYGYHGYGGWHGGWGGPRVGVYVGPGYWGGPYYDPYYYGVPPYYDPYAYAAYPAVAPAAAYPQAPAQESSDVAPPDNPPAGPIGLAGINSTIAQMRERLDYEYSDGDISRAEYKARSETLKDVSKQAKDDAAANGGKLTPDQEDSLLKQLGLPGRSRPTPPAPRSDARAPSAGPSGNDGSRDLTGISDLHMELTTLLDQKLKDGDITKSQHAAEMSYINQLDKQAHDEAGQNGGQLTADQEEDITQQLHRAYYSINHNLVSQ